MRPPALAQARFVEQKGDSLGDTVGESAVSLGAAAKSAYRGRKH